VFGDVNSTAACALAAVKLGIPVVHVEAGLRSFDRSMPEEINRIIADALSDLLLVSEPSGVENLKREGVDDGKVHLVGNVMIDTLVNILPKAEEHWNNGVMEQMGEERYALVTLHRPSNVDEAAMLKEIMTTLEEISQELTVIYPVHPRTKRRISEFGLPISENGKLNLTDPMGYLDFLALQKNATVVITDSGGIQEETTYLGVPCLTVRKNTERPITVEMGTNILVGQDIHRLKKEVYNILDGKAKKGRVPSLWDGKASERIVEILLEKLY
jgi:UDP-N-acetylglucosamine 2-epimerase (non-hydrolysing)